MELFITLELPYLVIGIFILSVTAFVTTRDFMAPSSFKKGMIGVSLFLGTLISLHYYITTTRMDGVKKLFNEGETIICENKMRRTISQSVLISKKLGWRLEGNLLKSDDYERDFLTARCVDWIGDDIKATSEANNTK